MKTFIDYPIYGNEEEMAVVRTGEVVKANRKLGYRRCLTKNAKKDLYDRYGTLYMSTISAIQQFDPACCTNVFIVLCELTKEETNIIDYSVKNITKKTGFSPRTVLRAMAVLRKCNIVIEKSNDIGDVTMYMNPLVFSKMSKNDRFNFYAENDCCVVFSPEDFRKELR